MGIRDEALHGIRSQNWNLRAFWMPPELARVPTMLSAEECRMLAWIAQSVPTGQNAVIDLGSFLGGSTAHLAYGLSRVSPEAKVDAFDQFTIDDKHKTLFLTNWGHPTLEGNDMEHLFQGFVSPFGKANAHRGLIEDATWDGRLIDLLFVDVCKSWSAMYKVMREFYVHLIPGTSVVIHQDYQHYQQPWVPATTYALRDKLELISYTQENSAIFLCKDAISRQDVEDVIACMSDIHVVMRFIKLASSEFPHARQREAMWQHVTAFAKNPQAQNSWELTI